MKVILVLAVLVLHLPLIYARELVYSPSTHQITRVASASHGSDVPVSRVKRSTHPCEGSWENATVPTGNGIVLCMVPGDDDLTSQLKEVGGFNKHYVAVTKEAANDFESLLPPTQPSKKFVPFPIIWSHKRASSSFSTLSSRKLMTRKWMSHKSKAVTHRSEKDANIESSVITRCTRRGSLSEQNLIRSCTECQRISKLSFDRFPHYINEVACDSESSDLQARDGVFCQRNEGMCIQRYLLIDLLVRTDKYVEVASPNPDKYFKAYKQIWEPYTQKIRSCCECQMF